MNIEPILTQRLLLRPVRETDATALAERRSDPRVARYQDWVPPVSLAFARERIANVIEMAGPRDGQWWMLTVADRTDKTVLGDLVIKLDWQGRAAEMGYTFAHEYWAQGYATEAVAALLEYLFRSTTVVRVSAGMDPDNVASAGVLERTGFIYEGRTRLSYWVGEQNTDDLLYGLTVSDWQRWTGRCRKPPADVRLVRLTPANLAVVRALETHKSQERFVSPVAKSLAEALVPPLHDGHPIRPWFRAIEADGELVGFIMLALPGEHLAEPYLLRLLIDRMHQRRGIGRRVLDQLVDDCQRHRASTLKVSWTPGRGSPEPLYLAYGFRPTGTIDDGEIEAQLRL